MRLARNVFAVAALGCWIAVVAAGFWWLQEYETTPGPADAAPVVWPEGSSIGRAPGKATLVMFAHPLCPCSRASVAGLDELVRRAGPLTAHVLMMQPVDAGPDWADASLAETAARIPGVSVSKDPDGREAARFGARTSGHVVIYDALGRLTFSGGITASRGHAGESIGFDSALDAAKGSEPATTATPVYGCCLKDRQ
jgi:hypothetical protein